MITLTLIALTASAATAQEVDTDVESIVQDRLDRVMDGAAEHAQEQAAQAIENHDALERPSASSSDGARNGVGKVRDQDEISASKEDSSESGDSEDEDGHSSRLIRDLGADESAEHDEHGYSIRHSELLGVDLKASTLAAVQARGFKVISRHSLLTLNHQVVRLAVPPGMSTLTARRFLRNLDPGSTIDFVHYYGLGLTAGGHGHPVKSGAIWPRSRLSLTVGMIDTAVSAHETLAHSRIKRWSSGDQSPAPREHGTAVASLLAREGDATIFAANIFRGPVERPYTSADVIVDALEWLFDSKVSTVNVSLAGPRNAVVDRLILDAIASGHTFVAAAGNDGPTAPPAYPAALPGVIAVTAVDSRNRIYRYANHGRYIAVAALGVDVVAARAGGGLARFTGTSFAAPHVAGWLARCRTAGETATQCADLLRHTAKRPDSRGFDDTYGFGVIE